MNRIRSIFKNKQKIYFCIIVLLLVLFFSVGIPTMAKYKNRNMVTLSVWDGTIAANYRSGTGTIENPYVIADGSELALLASNLNATDYDNTYFTLSNDIVLNNGIFSYDNNLIRYNLNGTSYYVEEWSNNYYSDSDFVNIVGSINQFNPLNNFKGNLDGNSHRIFGLYMTSNSSDELGLFTDLKGNVSNLVVDNSLIYGGFITGGLASSSNNATISNTIYDGYVIGNSGVINKSISAPNINKEVVSTSEEIVNINSKEYLDRVLFSSSISGVNNSNGTIKINDIALPAGNFTIDLGTNLLTDMVIKYETTDGLLVNLSNINYNISYQESLASGIVGESRNVNLTNVVNKAKVSASGFASGLIGRSFETSIINNSYNTGNIISQNYTSGLISSILTENDVLISNSYNSGSLSSTYKSGFITNVYGGSDVTIQNSFDEAQSDALIKIVNNSTINVSNCYFISSNIINNEEVNIGLTRTTINNLKNKDYIKNNLLFNEFIDMNNYNLNNSNIWLFNEDSFPRLFIDDNLMPASINAGTYSWNNMTSALDNIYMPSNIVFSIDSDDSLNMLTSIEYFISDDVLTMEQIRNNTIWTTYTDYVEINTEGSYIVYAKVVDSKNNTYYLNSDNLVLDLTSPSVSINMENNFWNGFNNSLHYVYVDSAKEVNIVSNDLMSGIEEVKYYISNEILTLGDLEDIEWLDYNDGINISNTGINIVYIKVLDKCNNITYANSDYIVIEGYSYNNIMVGNEEVSDNVNITDKSSIALNYTFAGNNNYSNTNHNIISNILLPLNSKIIIKDNILNKYYKYVVNSSEDIYGYNDSCSSNDCIKKAVYPFSLFKEIGSMDNTKVFNEEEYSSSSEDFTIVLDLSNTNITNNYTDVLLYLEIRDNLENVIIPTLDSSKNYFSIYHDNNPSIYLNHSGNMNALNYNSNSVTEISITSGTTYQMLNNKTIYDTDYMDRNNYLRIELFNSNNVVVEKKYLKNITIEYKNKKYYAYNDGSYYIDMGSSSDNINDSIKIITSSDNSKLENGNYYFKVINYLSYDGIFNSLYGSNELIVPVVVENGSNDYLYNFDVKIDSANRIINKDDNSCNLVFNVLYNGDLNSPNAVVSLYRKNLLTAYDQDYTIVDLKTFSTSNLVNFNDNYNYLVRDFTISDIDDYNNLSITLDCSKFDYTGYQFIFDLYDGNTKIDTIGKKIIVK